MKVTYQRQVLHCEPSPYVKEVTVKEIKPAENSDLLDTVTFNEIGWYAITRRDSLSPGDRVMFIPPDSVLPFELSELLNITTYLSKGKVMVTNLRGNRSEGLIVTPEKVTPYLPYIMKWEDPPTVAMRGEMMARGEIPFTFERFYRMPNILNVPDTFSVGEPIFYSEKVHGVNSRFAMLVNPKTEKHQLYVGSHDVVLREKDGNLFWKVANKLIADKLPPDYVFYGEIFGIGVQHYHYGRKKHDILLFAAKDKDTREYMLPSEFLALCEEYKLPHVTMHERTFTSLEELRKLADEPSELTDLHWREGIVISSGVRRGKMAKCIGFKYLEEKKRTERH